MAVKELYIEKGFWRSKVDEVEVQEVCSHSLDAGCRSSQGEGR